jgi:hypothetical protein
MNTDPKDASNLNLDNIIPATLEDLSEDDQREIERELEEEKAERLKVKLAGYLKTRNGFIKKVPAPNLTAASSTEVNKSPEEIAHLVDVSVASKYGSDMANAARTVTQLANKFEEFETSLPHKIRSLLLQTNGENFGKNLAPLDNGSQPSNMHTPGVLANVTQPAINNVQGSQNYVSSAGNNFVPSIATPIVSV